MRKYLAFTLFPLSAAILLAYQNCGVGASSSSTNASGFSSLTPGPNVVQPIGGTPAPQTSPTPSATPLANLGLVADCMNHTAADACVFLKDPVSQDSAPVPQSGSWYDNLAARQRNAVLLTNLDGTGYLQNDTIAIMGPGIDAGTTQRLTKNPTQKWRVAVNSEVSASQKGFAATQVSAFYWLNKFIGNLESSPLIGTTYLKGSQLHVNPYATSVSGKAWQNAAYYTGGTFKDSVIIGYGANQMPLAFSGDVIIHEFSHALVNHGTSEAASQLSTMTHRYCLDGVTADQTILQDGGVCCKSTSGCMKAMNEGLADYFASISFNSNPTIGEGFTNTLTGLRTCQTGTPYRNVLSNKSLTSSSVFNQCVRNVSISGVVTSVTATGEIYTMGTLYTSILWEIRNSFLTRIPSLTVNNVKLTGSDLFDAIVYDHIMSLNGTATFSSSRVALKNSASAIVARFNLTLPNGVNLQTIIDSEFTLRGIN